MRNNINKNILLLLFIVAGAWVADLNAQVVVPFKQRTAAATPAQTIYNLKGDFQMIGNSNMTNTGTGNTNGNTTMSYIDIDGDPQTLNSSSATLQFPAETGVDHNCSEIVYAGLYWTGRAHDGNTGSPNTFTVTKQNVPGAGGTPQPVNNNYTVSHNGTINYTDYAMTVSRQGGSNNRYVRYTFTSSVAGQPTVLFEFQNNTPYIRYSTNNGATWTNATNQSTTNSGNTRTTTFDPVTVYSESGGIALTVNSLVRDSRMGRTQTQYQSSSTASVNVSGTYAPPATVTKNYDKSVVYLKHADASGYTTISAQDINFTSNIYYPSQSSHTGNYMYAAYAEVTDYVKQHGVGEYFVADMALREGNGGGTGFYGGWGLIVIYENPKMKWRDITIFDGYAYVQGSTTISHELPVSGFRTAQNGPIRIKMGLIAGEGDLNISGDYFQIRNQANTNWVDLSHSQNTAGNFFNSSIPGDNPRNPSYDNNYGLDVAMFEVNNPSNSIIGNDQTSTRFRYGSTQDTYIIPVIALAVDAFVPDVRAFIDFSSSTSIPPGGITPGTEIEYTLELSNASNEEIINVAMDIPIPYTATHVSSSATYPGMTPGDQPVYTETEGGNFIHWTVGDLPAPDDPNDPPILATLTFKLKVTDNCDILVMDDCLPTVAVSGKISGTGANSGQNFSDLQFITGYTDASGGCESVPEYGPLSININVGDYCPTGESSPTLIDNQVFLFCNGETVGNIYNIVKPNYPAGTRFYDEVVNTTSDNGTVLVTPAPDATEYTSTNDFPEPAENTAATYYAVPFGSSACAWSFTIEKGECNNYWVGTNTTDWDTASNWSRNQVPDPGKDVEFATAANNNGQAAVNDLHVPANNPKTIGNLTNASDKDLVVVPASFLTINGTVTDGNADAGTIVVQADPADLQPAGTLFFATPGDNANVGATVQFYNRAYQCADCGLYRQSWQYFGIPVKSAAAFPTGDVDGDETINQWVEPFDGNKWQTAPYTPDTELKAFKGYEITNSSTSKPTGVYSFAGLLNVGDATVSLTRTADVNYSGVNLVGNSYTAAIPISAEAITFPGSVTQTLYLFNTGTRDEWRKLNGTTLTGHKSGQYLAVPVNLGGQNDFPDRIPSAHAFMLLAEEGFTSGNLTINYNKLVENTKVKLGDGATEIVTRSAESNTAVTRAVTPLPSLTMDVIGKESADRVWIFAKSGATHGFDNGWDGRKIEETDIVQLYVQGADESRMQVATVPHLNNVTLGFEADVDGEYRIEFALSEQLSGGEIYLHDILTGEKVQITERASYSFEAKKGTFTGRFRLSSSGSLFAGEDALITVYDNADGSIGINNQSKEDCSVYISDTSGVLQHRVDVKANTRANVNISKGVYVVRIQNAVVNDVRRVTVK